MKKKVLVLSLVVALALGALGLNAMAGTEENTSMPVATAQWVSSGAVTVDGTASEKAWMFDSWIRGASGEGSVAKLWNGTDLYLAIKTDGASSLKATLNEKVINVTLGSNPSADRASVVVKQSGNIVEMKVPFSSIGFAMHGYTQQMPMVLELTKGSGTSVFSGKLTFNGEYLASDGVSDAGFYHGTYDFHSGKYGYTQGSGVTAVNPNTGVSLISAINLAQTSGQVGAQTETVNGEKVYHLWNKYQVGKANYMVQYSRIAINGFGSLAAIPGAAVLDFDVKIADMPEVKNPISSAVCSNTYQTTGFGVALGRVKVSNSADCEQVAVSIANVTGRGLVLYVKTADGAVYDEVTLNRQISDKTMHMSIRYGKDCSVDVLIDDVVVYHNAKLPNNRNGYFGTDTVAFTLWNPAYDAGNTNDIIGSNYVPLSSAYDSDIMVSNVKLCTLNEGDLLDNLTFDAIKGGNTDASNVSADLNLPATLEDPKGRFTTELVWSSEPAGLISATGVVTPPEKLTDVVLTATVKGSNPAITKNFNLTLSMPPMDAWKADTVTVDGNLSEYYDFARGYTFSDGNAIAARWTEKNLYIAAKYQNADTFAMMLGGKVVIADLVNKTVDLEGAEIAVGNGTVELALPMHSLGLDKIEKGTSKALSVIFAKGEEEVGKTLLLSFYGVKEQANLNWVGSATIDGKLTEKAWQMHNGFVGRPGSPEGKIGKLWNEDNLFLAIDTDGASTMMITVAGRKVELDLTNLPAAKGIATAISKSGDVVELQIPFADFYTLYNYGQTIDVSVELTGNGTSVFAADLRFTSQNILEAAGAGIQNAANPSEHYGPATNPNNALAIGQVGYTAAADANGNYTYQMWNKYVPGQTNYGVQRVQTYVDMSNRMLSTDGTLTLDFDLCVADMAVYSDPTSGNNIWRSYQPVGLGIGLGRYSDNSEELNLSITNMEEGLVMFVGYGPFTDTYGSNTIPYHGPFKLGKQVGDQFHVTLHYTEDGKVAVYVDDALVVDFVDGGYSYSIPGRGVQFNLWAPYYHPDSNKRPAGIDQILNSDSSPKNSDFDMDVIIANVKLGDVTCNDLMDLLTLDTVMGANISPDLVMLDLTLPTSLSDGRLTSDLVWASSKEDAISNTGVVNTDNQGRVTLTANLGEKVKKFNFTVAASILDAWKGSAYTESRGYTFQTAGKPQGEVNARWDDTNLYLQLENTDATKFVVVLGEKSYSADVAGGVAEVKVALSDLALGRITSATAVPAYISISGANGTATKKVQLSFFGAFTTLNAGWEDSVTVNGSADEGAWQFYREFHGRPGSPKAKAAALWCGTDLYLAVNGEEASKLNLVVNGKKATVDLASLAVIGMQNVTAAKNGGVIELKIPFDSVGFTLVNYGQSVPVQMELEGSIGVSGLSADVIFTAKEHAASAQQGTFDGKNPIDLRFGPASNVTSAFASGQAGYSSTKDSSGNYSYRLWNIYQEDKTNYPIQWIQNYLDMGQTLKSLNGIISLDFDVRIDDMPEYDDPTSGDIAWRSYQPAGLGITLGRFEGNTEELNLSVSNTKDGLVLYIGHGPFTDTYGSNTVPYYGPFKLGKQLGEQFHLTFHYTEDGQVSAYADEVLVCDFQDGGYGFAVAGLGLQFNLWNPSYSEGVTDHILAADSSPKNSGANSDVTISNVKIGSISCYDLRDLITFDTIKGQNGSPDLISKDLTLPATISDGNKLTSNITWSSSNTAVIANSGKVSTPSKNTDVKLTAKLGEFSKDFDLSVVLPTVDAWRTSSANVNGTLAEYYDFTRGYTFPDGSAIAARWTKNTLYIGAKYENADTLTITLGGKTITANLSKKTVSGVKGASVAVGNGTVELGIPMSQLGFGNIAQGTEKAMSVTLGAVQKNLNLMFFGVYETSASSWNDGSIAIDGILEEDWLMYTETTGRVGTPDGVIGKMWNGTDLFVAVDTDGASKMYVIFNGKTTAVDLNDPVASDYITAIAKQDDIVELKLSYKDFFNLVNYGQVIDIAIELENQVGVSGFDGGFTFISREHLASVNAMTQYANNALEDRFGPAENITAALASGQIGYTSTADENGRYAYHMWNKYQAGKKNYGVQSITTGVSIPEEIFDTDRIITLDFDVRIDDMPVYADPTHGEIMFRKYQPVGLGIALGRNVKGEEMSLAISNTKDGLALYVGYGPFTDTYGSGTIQWDGPYKINKVLGQEFHVMLHSTVKGELAVYVDDVEVYKLKEVGEDYSICGDSGVGFFLWSASYKAGMTDGFLDATSAPKNSDADTDIYISDVRIGESSGNDILDLVTYETIRNLNGEADSVVSNLTLPSTISDGKITAKLSWTSSNRGAITNGGTVYPQDKRTPVELTVSLVGAKPAISKTFPLTVVMPFIDTWQANFVKVDGDLSEYYSLSRGYVFASVSGKPSASIAAGWNTERSRLYYAIKYNNTTKITITMGSRVIVVDLQKQTLSGVKNAQMKLGEKNTVEIAIPLEQVRITEIKNNMLYDIGVKLENEKTSVSKNLTLAFYGQPSMAFASWDNKTVVVDGEITEQSWLLYSLIEGRPGTPEGSFGRLWNGTDLYMAVDTDGAKKMTLTLGEKTMAVDLAKATPVVSGMSGVKIARNGDIVELKIPFKSFGFTLRNYTEQIAMRLELSNAVGTSGFYGRLQFSSREALVNGGEVTQVMQNIHDIFGTDENAKLAKESGQAGFSAEVTDSGYSYRMWNIYQEGKKNYPIQRISTGFGEEIVAAMESVDQILAVDFDVRIDDMPEYKDVEIPDTFFRQYQPAGLGVFLGRNLPGEEISFVITNEQNGLAIYVGTGPFDDSFGSQTVKWEGPYYVGKELGQQFHVSVHQTKKGEVQIFIDDTVVFATRDVGADFVLGNSGISFSLWNQWYAEKYNAGFLNEDSSLKNSEASSDVTISNVQVGAVTCYDLLDYLDFDYIKGNNGDAENVITDLALPGKLSDGKLTTGVSWESKKPEVISAKGQVTTQDKEVSVVLKASITGTDPVQYKELEVSVTPQPVDSWYNANVILDGKAQEYHDFQRGYAFEKREGSVGAAWDDEMMYIAIKHNGADSAKIKIEGKTLMADFAKGTVSGIDGAKIAVGEGVAEIAIPKSILKERAVKEGRVDMVVTLVKGEAEIQKGLRMSFYGKVQDGIVGWGGNEMKVDGSISETAYQLYGQLKGRLGTAKGLVGKVWSGKDLYLAIFVDDAKTVKLSLNGKTATIDPRTLSKTGNLISSIAKGEYRYLNEEGEIETGTLLEMKIPFTAFGFDMYAYNLTADLSVEMTNNVGVSAYITQMAFTNKVSKNYLNELGEIRADNAQSGNADAATAGLTAGSIGGLKTELGDNRFTYHMWNLYNEASYGFVEALSYSAYTPNDDYEPMVVKQGDWYFDFDVRVDKMQEKNQTTEHDITNYGNDGLSFQLQRGIEGQELICGIGRMKDMGLVFTLREPENAKQIFYPVNRELKETFHVSVLWHENGDVDVFIDDEKLCTYPAGALGKQNKTSAYASGWVKMSLLAEVSWSKMQSAEKDVDFTVSNLLTGYAESDDLLEQLTFDTIKGENRRDTEVWKDLVLPKVVTDGVISSNIVWESSNPSVISVANGVAKVIPQDEDVKVTLTARMTGNKEIYKTFEITVTCPIVDAQLVGTAKTASYKLPDGSALAARWEKDNIYLDITGKNTAELTFGDKTITVSDGVMTGVEGGKATVSGSKLTITLPRTALGITIPEYHTTQRIAVNGKVLKLEFVGYDSVADEYLASQSLKEFVAGLKKITGDITLPQTYTSQFVDGKLTMAWCSDTVRVLDNNGKVTRPSKVDALVRLSLMVDGVALKTFDANVIAESSPDLASTTDLRVPFGKDIKIDGSISEQGWSMNCNLTTADKVIGKMGVQWDTEYLYMAFKTGSAKSLTITLEGKTANINLNSVSVSGDLKIAQSKKGSYLELKIALKDLGLANIIDYGEKITAKVMLDSATFDGIFALTSIQWFATDNPEHRFISKAEPDDPTADEQFTYHNWAKTENGFYMYDLYQYGKDNKAGLVTGNAYVNSTIKGTEIFAPMEKSGEVGLYTEFDFQSLSMPIYEGGVTGENKVGSHTFMATAGISWQVGGYANKVEAKSEWLSLGMHMTDSGLVIMVRVGSSDFYSFPTGKHNGDMFRIGVAWTKDDTLILFVDGEKIGEVEKAVTYGTTMSAGGLAFRVTRNANAAECESDSFKFNVSNMAMGYYYGECILDNIEFNEIRDRNLNYAAITDDLNLMAEFATPQISSGKLTWASSDPAVAPDGTVTRPEDLSYALARLTVENELGHTKEIVTAVKGYQRTENVLIATKDYNVPQGAGTQYDQAMLVLDQDNTSVIYDLKESQKVNVVKLTELDHENRLKEDSLSLWISDDNVTYWEIKDFKFYQSGTETYLYDFEETARYVKVHCTHRDAEESLGEAFFPEIIRAYYEEVFGDNGASFGTKKTVTVKNTDSVNKVDWPWSFTASELGIVSLAENMADIRIFLGDELLYHYVEDGMITVRIPEIKAGGKVKLTVLSGNQDAKDISNKEGVYEVIYGTREIMPNSTDSRLDFYRIRIMYTLPDGTIINTNRANDMWDEKSVDCRMWSYSTDNGRSWKYMGAAEAFLVGPAPGGFVYDPHANILYSFGYTSGSRGSEYLEMNLVKLDLNNGIENAKWEYAGSLTHDLHTALNYAHGTTLSCYDGDGPNVDMLVAYASGHEGEDLTERYVRVSYTVDAGKNWIISDAAIEIPDIKKGFEAGLSEPSTLELDDGTLVMTCRYQSEDSYSFGYSYSTDHGITWTEGVPSNIPSVNTQPMFHETYGDFDIFAWAGNNIQGGESYQRYPQNLAIPVVEEDYSNISVIAVQNTYLRTYMQNLQVDNHRNTNLYITHTADGAVLIDAPVTGDHLFSRVDDYEDYLTKTKGSFDSFEQGSIKYEGWSDIKGMTQVSDKMATDGQYSMQLYGQSVRYLPYFRTGSVSFDLNWNPGTEFKLELAQTYSPKFMEASPVGFVVDHQGNLMLGDYVSDSGLDLQAGWNKVQVEVDLNNGVAKVSVNGSEPVDMPIGEAYSQYVTYMVMHADNYVYVDNLIQLGEYDDVRPESREVAESDFDPVAIIVVGGVAVLAVAAWLVLKKKLAKKSK